MIELTNGPAALLAQTPVGPTAVGEYMSMLKMLGVVVLSIPWLLVAPWIYHDTRRVRTHRAAWSGAILGAGVLGLLVWLLLSVYVVGLLIYVVMAAATIISYVVYRNGRVPPEHRVLTGEHLSQVFSGGGRKEVQVETRVKLYTDTGKIVHPPSEEQATEEKIEAYNLMQSLLYDVLAKRASMADVTPAGQQTRIRLVVDGVPTDREPMSIQESEAMIQELKPVAGMDPEERRRPQNGRITVDIAGKPVEIDVATAGTTGGQRLQLRSVEQTVHTRLEELGMSEKMLERVRELNHAEHGLIIVSGPSGNGVTSTLYSLLRDHDAFIYQLVSLEAKPDVDLDNVTQVAYGEKDKLPNALASAIRRDPDVIMVDQCPDPKSAGLISEAAAEKNLILGMRATDTFTALAKWWKLCEGEAAGVRRLGAVLCQVLLRKLCPKCREAYRPDPQLLAKANLASAKIDQFYRPPTDPLTDEKGNPITCSTCQGTGYFGRTAAFELLEMTDELREMVVSGASLSQIKTAARKNRMLYLQEQALRKVIAGVTSIQEVIRVTQQARKS